MKTTLRESSPVVPTLMAACWLLAGTPAFAASKIDRVVVLADRAEVTRLTQVECKDGRAQAEFPGLPVGLDARTLRGGTQGAGSAIGVASEVVTHQEARDDRARSLNAELDKLRDQIRAEESRRATLAAQDAGLRAYARVLTGILDESIRNPRPETAAWGRALDQMRGRHLGLKKDDASLVVAIRKLRTTEGRLERQLADLGPAGAETSRRAVVAVDCGKADRVTATLSYVVPCARWRPEYDLDFSPGGKAKVGTGRARLTVGAVIQQATGENWQDVELVLSTARPRLGAEAPVPAPLWVNGHEQKEGKVLVEGQERRDRLEAGGGAGTRGPQEAQLDDKGNTFLIKLPHRTSIVSDGRPYWTPVDVIEAGATAKLVAIPKLRPYVYHLVALKNPAAYPLLEGNVRSYRRGSYVGQTHLRHHGVGETVEVSLGIDEELKVERKDLERKDRDPRFLASTRHFERAYRIVFTNRARDTENVELRESIPVSKIEAVKVELVAKQTTPGFKHDAERGFLTWTLKLDRAQEKSVDLAYTIHLPEDWQVNANLR